MLRRSLFALLLLLLSVAACDKPKETKPDESAEAPAVDEPRTAESGIDIDDPTTCKGCHATIYREWTESMHSRAHHDKDPIYGAMREFRMKKQGDQIAGKCANCHNPRDPKNPDSTAGMAGVSCATCHNVSEVHVEEGKVGAKALEWEEGDVMRSSRDLEPGASPVHGTGEALGAMEDGKTLCLSCHNETRTPGGAPACTTGAEFSDHGGDQSCVSCHMPEVDGPAGAVGRQKRHASHKFPGPHRAWSHDDPSLLESAVDVSAEFRDGRLAVTLQNQSAHGFPTGFPGRNVLVKVVGTNDAGEVLWQNVTDKPMAEDPKSVLNKVYHDKEGKPVPAAFSVKMARDTRLKPDEARTISYDLPEAATTATVTVHFRLLPPKLAKVLGIADREVATPRTIAEVAATR